MCVPNLATDFFLQTLSTEYISGRPCLFLGKHSSPLVKFIAAVYEEQVFNDCLLGLLTTMFATAGTLLNVSKRGQNLGKVGVLTFPQASVLTQFQSPRYHIDAWEEMMMDRDKRLTGHMRGQSVCLSLLFDHIPNLQRFVLDGTNRTGRFCYK